MQPEPQPDRSEFSPLEDQIRECFGRVVYTRKTHEKMADRCSATLQRYKLCQIGVSVLTTSGALSVVFLDQFWLKLATAFLSIVGLWASGYMKGLTPVAQHKSTGTLQPTCGRYGSRIYPSWPI